MEGLYDPFCRRPYPWGEENGELLEHYRRIGEVRKNSVFDCGDFDITYSEGALLIYERSKDGEIVTVAVNFSEESVRLPVTLVGRDLYSGKDTSVKELCGYGFCIIGQNDCQ